MEKLSKVLIFAEKESQFGLLCSAAKSIAEHTAAFAVASAPACPVDKAFVVADQGIVFDDYFETFAAVTAEYAPDAIIVSSEKRMRSIAARIAAVCKTAVIADVNAMEVAEGKLYCSHLVYGGAAVRCESSAADTTVVVPWRRVRLRILRARRQKKRVLISQLPHTRRNSLSAARSKAKR